MTHICSRSTSAAPSPTRPRTSARHRHRQEARGAGRAARPGPKHGGLGSGVVGDFIGDDAAPRRRPPGGLRLAREELDAWEERLGRELADGLFGENLTTPGSTSTARSSASAGRSATRSCSRSRAPDPVRDVRLRGWARRAGCRRFTEVGRTGAYLAVVSAGTVRQGDPIEVVSRPDHGITRADSRSGPSRATSTPRERVLAARCLNDVEHAELLQTHERRTRAGRAG